ncbi:ExbD/TolR family protein [Verrucomicrobiota bacterium]
MRFTREAYEEVRINMDPMIDCVFLLIIFFLTTTAFIKLEQDLSINLPTMSEKLKIKKPPAAPIVVNVRYLPGGKAFYHVDNEKMSLTALTINLTRAKIRSKDQAVVIRGDKNVKWDHVAKVMACCGQAGITKVSATVEVAE